MHSSPCTSNDVAYYLWQSMLTGNFFLHFIKRVSFIFKLLVMLIDNLQCWFEIICHWLNVFFVSLFYLSLFGVLLFLLADLFSFPQKNLFFILNCGNLPFFFDRHWLCTNFHLYRLFFHFLCKLLFLKSINLFSHIGFVKLLLQKLHWHRV